MLQIRLVFLGTPPPSSQSMITDILKREGLCVTLASRGVLGLLRHIISYICYTMFPQQYILDADRKSVV